jgi:hypothetical protein
MLSSHFKTGQADLYVPDSITVFSNRDTTLELPGYSPAGNLTIDYIKIRAGVTWLPFYYYECFYDENGYPSVYIDKEWKDEEWVNLYKYDETYDASGHILLDQFEEWSGNAWVKIDRYIFDYDEPGNMASQTYQVWVADNWTNDSKINFTHDAKGNVLTDTYLSWSDGAWLNGERLTHTYDAYNNNLENFAEIWSVDHWEANGRWRNSYTYDSQGRILTFLVEHEFGSWENSSRGTYSYNSKGQLTSYLGEGWIDEAWQNTYNSTCYYDQFDNPTLQEFFVWDADSAKWGHSQTEPFTFLVNGQEQWTFSSGIKMMAHWVQLGVSGVPEHAFVQISISPNPVETTLRITGDVQVIKVEVFTINGAQLEIKRINNRNLVDVSRLPMGLYLLKVTTSKGSILKRFVKD